MTFRPNEYRNKDGIGMPADDIALTTTDPNTMVALLKGIFGKLGGGTTTVLAADQTQGSTTAGQNGPLMQGAVTTAAPAYADGKTNPLSLEADGDLRTHDTAATALLTTAVATLSTLNFNTDTLETALGITTETAPTSDTGAAGLNGRLQRIAQILSGQSSKLTSLDDLYALIAENAVAEAVALDQLHLDIINQPRPQPKATARLVSAAATTNATMVQSGPSALFHIQGYNVATSVRYLKLFTTPRAPVVGTDVPVKTLPLPPGIAFAFDWPEGYPFPVGLSYALTTGSADTDTGALTLADVLGLNLDYA